MVIYMIILKAAAAIEANLQNTESLTRAVLWSNSIDFSFVEDLLLSKMELEILC